MGRAARRKKATPASRGRADFSAVSGSNELRSCTTFSRAICRLSGPRPFMVEEESPGKQIRLRAGVVRAAGGRLGADSPAVLRDLG